MQVRGYIGGILGVSSSHVDPPSSPMDVSRLPVVELRQQFCQRPKVPGVPCVCFGSSGAFFCKYFCTPIFAHLYVLTKLLLTKPPKTRSDLRLFMSTPRVDEIASRREYRQQNGNSVNTITRCQGRYTSATIRLAITSTIMATLRQRPLTRSN